MEKKVKGDSNLVRDSHSGAIINSNSRAYQAALKRKELGEKISKMETDLNGLTVRIDDVQSAIVDLQHLIGTIIKKLDK